MDDLSTTPTHNIPPPPARTDPTHIHTHHKKPKQGLARKLNPQTQVCLLSATFAPETTKAAQEIFPRDSFVTITLEDHQLNRANIQQVRFFSLFSFLAPRCMHCDMVCVCVCVYGWVGGWVDDCAANIQQVSGPWWGYGVWVWVDVVVARPTRLI